MSRNRHRAQAPKRNRAQAPKRKHESKAAPALANRKRSDYSETIVPHKCNDCGGNIKEKGYKLQKHIDDCKAKKESERVKMQQEIKNQQEKDKEKREKEAKEKEKNKRGKGKKGKKGKANKNEGDKGVAV